jgi:hypothetical protein
MNKNQAFLGKPNKNKQPRWRKLIFALMTVGSEDLSVLSGLYLNFAQHVPVFTYKNHIFLSRFQFKHPNQVSEILAITFYLYKIEYN